MGGCHAPRLETIDQSVAELASRPFDVTPLTPDAPDGRPPTSGAASGGDSARRDVADPSRRSAHFAPAAFFQVEGGAAGQVPPRLQKFELKIPEEVPGAETPLIKLPAERAEQEKAVRRLYPELPPLPEVPVPLPGPNGRPYTLADLQQLAAANSPLLPQAASDVEAARGNLIQAWAYPNPTIGYEAGPNNNNTATGTHGLFIDQVIKTGGKLKLQAASAEMDLRNAELALRRARSDLATQVRTAYYNLLVAQETVRVNRALAFFTDEIYRLQADLLAGGLYASHEPAALRAQAFTIRLAYKQAIANYAYAWEQLVATLGLPHLPLSAVEGRVDRLIPYYEYDAVRARVLRSHTDVLTARNTLDKARYGLKLAQVTPVPDVEVRADLWKEFTVAPFNDFHTVSVSVPLPVWDRNRGAIRAAAATLVRASEGPHQVEVALTQRLATAYAAYETNLDAVEYYRRYILPDQVRYYRGVFERRKIDLTAPFADLVTAQQTLTANVTAYLGVLGTLWSSVVNVADFLQTEDLYQAGAPLELPELPDLDGLHVWPCPHPQSVPQSAGIGACPPAGSRTCPTPVPSAAAPSRAAPAIPLMPSAGRRIDEPAQTARFSPSMQIPTPDQPADNPDRTLPILEAPLSAPTSVAVPPGR
jgi:cobalt-zinc-cadmium efflux system outer membrane protein